MGQPSPSTRRTRPQSENRVTARPGRAPPNEHFRPAHNGEHPGRTQRPHPDRTERPHPDRTQKPHPGRSRKQEGAEGAFPMDTTRPPPRHLLTPNRRPFLNPLPPPTPVALSDRWSLRSVTTLAPSDSASNIPSNRLDERPSPTPTLKQIGPPIHKAASDYFVGQAWLTPTKEKKEPEQNGRPPQSIRQEVPTERREERKLGRRRLPSAVMPTFPLPLFAPPIPGLVPQMGSPHMLQPLPLPVQSNRMSLVYAGQPTTQTLPPIYPSSTQALGRTQAQAQATGNGHFETLGHSGRFGHYEESPVESPEGFGHREEGIRLGRRRFSREEMRRRWPHLVGRERDSPSTDTGGRGAGRESPEAEGEEDRGEGETTRPRVMDNLSYKRYLDHLARNHAHLMGGRIKEPPQWEGEEEEDATIPPLELGPLGSPIKEPRRLRPDTADELPEFPKFVSTSHLPSFQNFYPYS